MQESWLRIPLQRSIANALGGRADHGMNSFWASSHHDRGRVSPERNSTGLSRFCRRGADLSLPRDSHLLTESRSTASVPDARLHHAPSPGGSVWGHGRGCGRQWRRHALYLARVVILMLLRVPWFSCYVVFGFRCFLQEFPIFQVLRMIKDEILQSSSAPPRGEVVFPPPWCRSWKRPAATRRSSDFVLPRAIASISTAPRCTWRSRWASSRKPRTPFIAGSAARRPRSSDAHLKRGHDHRRLRVRQTRREPCSRCACFP